MVAYANGCMYKSQHFCKSVDSLVNMQIPSNVKGNMCNLLYIKGCMRKVPLTKDMYEFSIDKGLQGKLPSDKFLPI